jgi:hypothetical protein
MPREFICPACKKPVVTFMRPQEVATCTHCSTKVSVPEDATQTEAQPSLARKASPPKAGSPPEAAPTSEEVRRLVELGRQLPAPTYRLYPVAAIGLAAFLGGFLAGSTLVALNFRALGNGDRARTALWVGIGGMVAQVLVGALLPDARYLDHALWVGVAAATVAYAKRSQGALIEAHKILGGPFHSKWRAAGVGLLICLVSVAIIIAIVLSFSPTGQP